MATIAELKKYYADLLILQYSQKARARAHIEALVEPVLLNQVPLDIQEAFDLETAVGVNLDILGDYVGASRFGYVNNVRVELNDSDYRTLLKMVIISNNAGSSLFDIQSLISANFPNSITISDSQAMTMSYVLAETLGTPDLLEILINSGYLLRPMGVQISVTIVPSLDIKYFGFRDYNTMPTDISPFNSYVFYQITFPWLTY